jgi:hypothetical protein
MAKKKRSEAQEARRFAMILVALLALLGCWKLFVQGSNDGATIAWSSAALILACALFQAPLWLRLFRLWLKLAEGISFVMTRVILGLFFFGILTPIALLLRLSGRTPLDLGFKDGKASYWVDKTEAEQTLERYKRLY